MESIFWQNSYYFRLPFHPTHPGLFNNITEALGTGVRFQIKPTRIICRGSWYRILIVEPSGWTTTVGYIRQYNKRCAFVIPAVADEIHRICILARSDIFCILPIFHQSSEFDLFYFIKYWQRMTLKPSTCFSDNHLTVPWMLNFKCDLVAECCQMELTLKQYWTKTNFLSFSLDSSISSVYWWTFWLKYIYNKTLMNPVLFFVYIFH